MNPASTRDEGPSPAAKYREFLREMFERFKHDNGQDLSEWSEVDAPAVFDIIRFRSKDELKYYDPNKPEFWIRKALGRPRHTDAASEANHEFPPDPLSDEEFRRIQRRVCTERRHNDLLEQSIQRCELLEEELESRAEDVPSIEDPEDFEKEIEGLRRAFKNYCVGESDVSAEEESAEETESAASTQENILEGLNQSGDGETKEEEIEISTIRNFRPRKSSTFLEARHDDSEEDVPGQGAFSNGSSAGNSEYAEDTVDTQLCPAEQDESTLLVIRVTREESECRSEDDTDSATFTSGTSEQTSDVKGASANKLGASIVSAKHPPLHTLTPIQRRLVKLNLY